jgi:uncharacterized protein YPO0396
VCGEQFPSKSKFKKNQRQEHPDTLEGFHSRLDGSTDRVAAERAEREETSRKDAEEVRLANERLHARRSLSTEDRYKKLKAFVDSLYDLPPKKRAEEIRRHAKRLLKELNEAGAR